MPPPMPTQRIMKMQARQTRPRAKPRALRPICHTAATKVWTVRNWYGCISAGLNTKTLRERTHEGHQGYSGVTNLFDQALCCAIRPCGDDPVVSPPDIEDTTNCLHKVKREKRELSCNSISRANDKLSGRPCRRQQAPGTTASHHLGSSSCTNVRSAVQHPRQTGQTRERKSDVRQSR